MYKNVHDHGQVLHSIFGEYVIDLLITLFN